MKKGKWFLKWMLAGLVFLLVLGTVTMVLWNWLVPLLFNGPEIRFVEALGLLLLSRILFGGWGGRRCGTGAGPSWKHRYYDKLSSMTPEARERFKSRMQEKWCSHSSPEKSEDSGSSIG